MIKRLVVQKYGGSSVADAARLFNVARRIIETYDAGHPVCAVVSARGDTTDSLLRQALQVSPQPPRRELDVLLSAGERISCSLLAMAVNRLGRKAVSLTGSQTGIVTNSTHGRASILEVHPERIKAALDDGKIALVAGFQGVSHDADVTTLGRGGSDTTAAALAGALDAEVCEIYTDVDGVYTANPSVVLRAQRIPDITYDEMLELTSAGAGVLALSCVELSAREGIPVHVLSSFAEGEGTWVHGHLDDCSQPTVRGITYTLDEVVFELRGLGELATASTFLRALDSACIGYDATLRRDGDESRWRLICVVQEDYALLADEVFSRQAATRDLVSISSSSGMARVSAVGCGVGEDSALLSSVSSLFDQPPGRSPWRAESGLRISGLVPRTQAEKVVTRLHELLGLQASTGEAAGAQCN